MLERFAAAELHLEIKEPGISGAAGALIRERRAGDRVVASSFLWKELAPLGRCARIALTSVFPTRRMIRAAVRTGAWAIHPDHRRATAASVEAAHNAGLKVNAWTVNTPRAYARAARLGIDAVFSDNPLLLGIARG